MLIKGKAQKLGDNINTDMIIPGKFLVLTKPEELAKHAMAGLDTAFTKLVHDKSIIVAGRNFGCGSSREQAPVALKYSGVRCVLAESFARIFYRNAINVGLPVLECRDLQSKVDDGDELAVDLRVGAIENISRGERYTTNPLPAFMLDIVMGGLVEYMKGRK